jgi:hypothetical protein
LEYEKLNPVNLVHARVIDAITDGEDLAAFFNDLFKHRKTCSDLIWPAITVLADCYLMARDRGLAVGQPDESVSAFLGASRNRMLFDLSKNINSDFELAVKQLSGLVQAINVARNSGCTWHIPDQPQQAPVPVAIVSMVDRVTSTEVMRDGKGSITGSKQTERDAYPAI